MKDTVQGKRTEEKLKPHLSKDEQEQVRQRTAIGAPVVHEAIREEGESELKRTSSALAWSGLAAGLSMGFSLVAEGLIRSHLPDTAWSPLLSRLGYTVGFLIVILGRQQLFTENTLTVILPLLMRRTMNVLINVLRLWGVVLVTNLIGVFVFVTVVAYSNIFSQEAHQQFLELGRAAMSYGFATALIKGIFAGWLIALMVWLLPAAESTRIWVIIIITYIVGLGELTHVIAGSAEAFYLVAVGEVPFGSYIIGYLLPSLIGNIIGGVSIVAALNHAQVVAGSRNNG